MVWSLIGQIGSYKEDFTNSDVRLYHPLQVWQWIKGNKSWTDRREPLKPLHRDERIWNQLSAEQKETLDILDMRQLGMPTHALMAAGFHYAKRCDMVNQLYVLGKSEFKDPRSVLRLGRDVSNCAEDTFNFILEKCPDSFKQYAQCIENHGWQIYPCRKTQFAFDMCMYDNGQDKARIVHRETVIDDKDVPWGAQIKNPHDFRIAGHEDAARKHWFDPLRPLGVAPSGPEFKEYVQRCKDAGTMLGDHKTATYNVNSDGSLKY